MSNFVQKLAVISVLFVGGIGSTAIDAHSGGLDANGCHTNRKTGEYHCHRAPAKQSVSPGHNSQSNSETYYRNCDAVRAAGKAPLKRGQPGYASHLDRDGDGIACE
jgi:hypothetical protein